MNSMWWLYLDESGDLGFDFVNKKPSEFFTICILATSNRSTNRAFRYAVKKTLKRKVNHRRRKDPIDEFHAHSSSIGAKEYACNLLREHKYGIYSLTLNKRRVYESLAENKPRVYNYIARMVVDRIPFEVASGNVLLTVDRSKGSAQRSEFNAYITAQLQGRLDPGVHLDIVHEDSVRSAGLQLVDMFAWGVHRKHEQRDEKCYSLFADKVLYEERYL